MLTLDGRLQHRLHEKQTGRAFGGLSRIECRRALQRWVACKRPESSDVSANGHYMCPMLWCRDSFIDHPTRVSHTATCRPFDALYWCPYCCRPERYMKSKYLRLNIPKFIVQKKESKTTRAVIFFKRFALKNPSLRIPSNTFEMDDTQLDLSEAKINSAPVSVQEVPMIPQLSRADGNNFSTNREKRSSPQRLVEMPGAFTLSELPTPDPELESPDPDLMRSELSTPEPIWTRPELPTPDLSHKTLSSPGISSISSSPWSPILNDDSVSGLGSRQLRFPIQHPLSKRLDSAAEAGRTRNGTPSRPFHRRYLSDGSESLSLPSFPRYPQAGSPGSDVFASPNYLDKSYESEAGFTRDGMIFRSFHRRYRSDGSGSEEAVSNISAFPHPQHHVQDTTTTVLDSALLQQASESCHLTSPPSSCQFPRIDSSLLSSTRHRLSARRSVRVTVGFTKTRADQSDAEARVTRLGSPSTGAGSNLSGFDSTMPNRYESDGVDEMSEASLQSPREDKAAHHILSQYSSKNLASESCGFGDIFADNASWPVRDHSIPFNERLPPTQNYIQDLCDFVAVVNNEWMERLGSAPDLFRQCSKLTIDEILTSGIHTLCQFFAGVLDNCFKDVFSLIQVACAFGYMLNKDDDSYCWDAFFQDMLQWQYAIASDNDRNLFLMVMDQLSCQQRSSITFSRGAGFSGKASTHETLKILRRGRVIEDCKRFIDSELDSSLEFVSPIPDSTC